MSPEDSWLGITRLASHGSLDFLNISVWSAIRPASRSLCVTNGKGLNDNDARLGAIFEAVECACAEDVERLVVTVDNIAGLRRRGLSFIEFARFASARHPRPSDELERRWVKGKEMITERRIYAPFEMVGLDFRVATNGGPDTFVMSSVGLAAHTSREPAIAHALLETIENDALALAKDIPGVLKECDQIDAASLDLPWVNSLRETLHYSNSDIRLIDLTSTTKLPTILCLLEDQNHGAGRRMAYAGCACRGNERAAAVSAILEAVQSRVTDIAGTRDDIAPEHYKSFSKEPLAKTARRMVLRLGLPDIPDLDQITQALASIGGAGEAIIFDLEPDGCGVHCVRALIPGLELVDDGCRPRRLQRYRAAALARSLY